MIIRIYGKMIDVLKISFVLTSYEIIVNPAAKLIKFKRLSYNSFL